MLSCFLCPPWHRSRLGADTRWSQNRLGQQTTHMLREVRNRPLEWSNRRGPERSITRGRRREDAPEAPTALRQHRAWPGGFEITREAVSRMNDIETPNPLARYFGQIARGRLLTHAEEIDLGRRAREGDEMARTIRVPVHMGEKIRKMARVYNELSTELEREPTDGEVAGRIGWDIDRVKDVKSAIPDATSLNQQLSSSEESSELGDLVEDERESRVVGEVIRELETRRLMESVERLPERQRRVLIRRYGLDGEKPATLADLSEELAVSRERIRQLQREAERALRNEWESGQELPAAA